MAGSRGLHNVAVVWVLAAGIAGLLPRGAQGVGDPYELRHGSVIVDDCSCDRLPIERALRGSFLLTLDGDARYRLSEIELSSPGGEYVVAGTGTYDLDSTNSSLPQLALTLEINGAGGIELRGGPEERISPWPALDARASEREVTDPLHVYTVRIVAAPKVEQVPYAVEDGSSLTYWYSRQAPVTVPLTGSFLLGDIPTGNSTIASYRLDAIDVHGTADTGESWRLQGAGIYERVDRAPIQTMFLELDVDAPRGLPSIELESDESEEPAEFPAIKVLLRRRDPNDLHFYILRLIARPEVLSPPAFRRGDCNGDSESGAFISDAVFLLSYTFLGGPEPPCLAACDVNADGAVLGQVSDAVYLLSFAFLGGPPPAAPFPDCGPGGATDLLKECASPPGNCTH